jgi:transcriptional regulator with XRE-family HTH domain
MDLGSRLRALRTASGRTIAAVAAVAGLSVPYIANLENDRGNPTLAALERLAEALGVRLVIDLAPPPTESTGEILAFTESDRFQAHVTRIAKRTGVSERTAHERLVAVLDAAQLAAGTELSTLDCHRILDWMTLSNLD